MGNRWQGVELFGRRSSLTVMVWIVFLAGSENAQVICLGTGEAAPFATSWVGKGLLSRLRVGGVRDGKGRTSTCCVHEVGRHRWFHGVLSPGAPERVLRPLGRSVKGKGERHRWDAALAELEGASELFSLNAPDSFRFCGQRILWPGVLRNRSTPRVARSCPVALLVQCRASWNAARVIIDLELHFDLERLDIVVEVSADAPSEFPKGLAIGFPIRIGQACWLRSADGREELELEDESWVKPWPISGCLKLGGISGPGDLYCAVSPSALHSATLFWEAESDLLGLHWSGGSFSMRGGETRILRVALQRGAAPAARPLVWDPKLRENGSGLPVDAPGLHPVPIVRATRATLDSFLSDRRHGFQWVGEHAGDYMFSTFAVGNLEYDTILGLLMASARWKELRFARAARLAGDHLLCRDWDRMGSGLFFAHGADHRTGELEAGHHWVEGLMLLERLAPDVARGRLLRELLSGQVESFEELDLNRQFPRSLGWGLRALSLGVEHAPDRRVARREVRRWRDHLMSRQTRSGFLRLAGAGTDENHFQVNPFVQGGIVAPAWKQSLRVVPDSRARRGLMRLVRALSRKGVQKTEVRDVLPLRIVCKRRDGSVAGWTGIAPDEHAALFIAGIRESSAAEGRRASVVGLERGLGANLKLSTKSCVGPELSLLLRSVRWLSK